MTLPLVSIICLCYNHEKFLEEALLSLLAQDYPNKEIIIVDDRSTDGSVVVIEKLIRQYPEIVFIRHEVNLGNCTSFNQAFERSKGSFIIDFATDDVMLPEMISKQVNLFLSLPQNYGVVYSDAEIISEEGKLLGYHHRGTSKASLHPEGDVFKEVLKQYFICPPTMMMRRAVLERTHGYDATLAYEDFNFWIVSARDFFYAFIPEALVKRRVVKKSFSLAFYTRYNTRLFETTLLVLNKAFALCRTQEEKNILTGRVLFEMRHAMLMEEFSLAEGYKKLLRSLGAYTGIAPVLYFIGKYKIKLFWLYRVLLRLKGVYKLR
ncbi:MAG TPA: glycosyltransferase [Cytophagaceae bacterium]|nr:glycosyltransferase [Cytophagaceae bacterium]